jgi:hypothetical protein
MQIPVRRCVVKKAHATLLGLFAGFLALSAMASVGLPESRLQYSVDASSTAPPATVIKHGSGLTVVVFKVTSIQVGDTFSFNMSVSSDSPVAHYPADVTMDLQRGHDFSAAFSPSSLTLQAAKAPLTSTVTLTVTSAGDGMRVAALVKGVPPKGSHLGEGAGVEVIVTTQGATASASPEEQMLQDIAGAIAPEETMEK